MEPRPDELVRGLLDLRTWAYDVDTSGRIVDMRLDAVTDLAAIHAHLRRLGLDTARSAFQGSTLVMTASSRWQTVLGQTPHDLLQK